MINFTSKEMSISIIKINFEINLPGLSIRNEKQGLYRGISDLCV